MIRFLLAALLLCLALPAGATEAVFRLQGEIRQGALVLGTAPAGASVKLDGRPLRVSPSGAFVFGFGRDQTGAATLVVTGPDGRKEQRTLAIAKRDYLIQRIDNLPQAMVTPPAETLERIRREQAMLNATRRIDSGETWFAEGFRWPVTGPISGIYGSQRILNGEPRAPHLGVDVAVPTGTPIAAPAGGAVLLAEADFYYTGGTIVLDHGHGVTSIFMHLSRLSAAVGQQVKAGEIVGEVGATGRATGPHLHWGMYWLDRPIDPQPLVGEMPKH